MLYRDAHARLVAAPDVGTADDLGPTTRTEMVDEPGRHTQAGVGNIGAGRTSPAAVFHRSRA
ncbi:hypothetical protein ACFWD7_57900 [Streptomyces mirabilis]|uniref:hypothetical protein n=1 Tax=Streptomyces mirabilis TaxID=68239 RepID=UPI0036C05616